MSGIVLNFLGMYRRPMFRCANPAETGLACLAMICAWHGHDIDMATMRRRFPSYLRGATSTDLAEIASGLGLSARLFLCDQDSINHVRKPCIVFWNSARHVILEKTSGQKCFVWDPLFGVRRVSVSEMAPHLSSPIVELQTAEGFTRGKDKSRIGIFELIPL